ncbi:MAG: ATP-binding protein [Acidobacteriia bacterium]|nr:ATP-binding protein [Terriglobia bacterium]MYG02360.1 ATP-binding protein [Terriglobia bacterium]MYK08802.1 ATP-binding protein [Terriglobia bacterium]
MALAERVRIARRFVRSIRIDSDLGNVATLDGFVCPESSNEVLLTMARHISETGHGAYTWTGPYGSGKSSLAVALGALLNGNAQLRQRAAEVFDRDVSRSICKALPTGRHGWRIVPVVGSREDPVRVIGDAVRAARLVTRKPSGGWTESNLVGTLRSAAAKHPGTDGGVLLFLDEMGKFLEAAAQDRCDIFVFQQIAEAASRSKGRLLVIGVLHQSFEEYAHRLPREARDEWAKIQGRFIDLVVNASGEEQISLIARAIESDHHPSRPGALASSVAPLARRASVGEPGRLASTLEACWPLHPVVACLLGPVSRRRFGQNQRSIFGFLNSAEPHGLQGFLYHAGDDELYGPERLWDYLRANLEPSILASPDGHRWALATDALERCERIGGDALHVKLLKAIAVIDLFSERSGLVASTELLRACCPEIPHGEIERALCQLDAWSFTIFKKFLDARAIFAGSDFDIDEALRVQLEETGEIDFKELQSIAGLHPVLAKRHYHETGALRWFDLDIVPVSELGGISARTGPPSGAAGQFLLAIPTDGESEGRAVELCRAAASRDGASDLVVGLAQGSRSVLLLARELFALDGVRNDHPELAGDAVARREVSARLATLQTLLETELHRALDNALWFNRNQPPGRLRQRDLNTLASDMADRKFGQSPCIRNELLNRHKPSSNAVAAQNNLLHRMVQRMGEERLGIAGFPAERGLFDSLLEATGLYAQVDGRWRFVSPGSGSTDPCRLAPIWERACLILQQDSNRPIPVSELFEKWHQSPFGVKNGIMPVFAVAFILSQHNRVAVYRDGVFRARFDDVDVDYLVKDPSCIQLRWVDLNEVAQRLLSSMSEVVRGLGAASQLVDLDPLSVGRGLVAIYDRLPKWTARTMRLSANAIHIREIFKRAQDPNQFLFDDIPASFGRSVSLNSDAGWPEVAANLRDGLAELIDAYPSMLHRLRDLMLAELQAPGMSPEGLAELRDRAENIRTLAGDFRLDAFAGRLREFDGSDEGFEAIASLVANIPPRNWVDPDLDRAAVELAAMSQAFLRAETYARVKGRPEKRQAMAVVVGLEGRPAPLLEEFDVAESERGAVDDLITSLASALDGSNVRRPALILAALAELSTRFMGTSSAFQASRGSEDNS